MFFSPSLMSFYVHFCLFRFSVLYAEMNVSASMNLILVLEGIVRLFDPTSQKTYM